MDYIYLTNGYEIKETPFGEGVTIHNLDGLHRAIAADLVNDRPNWTGAELRFIRKELGFTQQTLGAFVSRDAQTVALWEKDKQPVPEEASNIIRGIYKSRMEGNVEFEKMIERINELDRQIIDADERMTAYKADASGWHTAKAA
ncbi:transcriptional regulator [bacterium endosymbiont of Escarpia laminata]|nr:MAG: transcriptional regulator [bacterium endosymbiont of Escarpia laminata]